MRLDSTGVEAAILRRRLPKLGHVPNDLPETSNRFSLRFSGSFVDGVSGGARARRESFRKNLMTRRADCRRVDYSGGI